MPCINYICSIEDSLVYFQKSLATHRSFLDLEIECCSITRNEEYFPGQNNPSSKGKWFISKSSNLISQQRAPTELATKSQTQHF